LTDQGSNVDALTPSEMLEKACTIGVVKANSSWKVLLPLAFLAGAYIAFGAIFASVVATGMSGVWPYGIMKLIQGLVFSMGLVLVIVGGAELFTGNNLMIIAWLQKKISLLNLFRNWLIVYVGNFLGSLCIALLVVASGEYKTSGGALGTLMLATANAKLQYGFWQALVLGILCNIMVCLAVWMTYSARSTTDKILSIILPITFFIAAGFEHSVANMYIIPVGLFLKTFNPAFYSGLNLDLSSLTWGAFFIKNLIPVTFGNILGGSGFVGLLYYWSYKKTSITK
jgi:formate transporter